LGKTAKHRQLVLKQRCCDSDHKVILSDI